MVKIEQLSTDFGSCWKPTEFNGYYVSKDGRVYSEKSNRIMKISKGGQISIQLDMGGTKMARVSRLVYKAFVGPLAPENFVGFKDEDTQNLNADNLFLIDNKMELAQQQRTKEARADGFARKYGYIHGYGPDDEHIVARTYREAEEMSGVGRTSIENICKGVRDSCRGWTFQRLKDNDCAW